MVPGSAKKVVEAKDDEITKQVKDCFKEAPKLKSLDVRTDSGVVTLQGKLPTVMDSARASQRAREVPDVRSVRNDTTSDSPKVSLDTDRSVTRARPVNMKKPSETADMPSTARADVRAAQEKLKVKGYDPGPSDGDLGAAHRSRRERVPAQGEEYTGDEPSGRRDVGHARRSDPEATEP